MSKFEGKLKSALMQEIKHTLPGFYVLQHSTRAAPDRSLNGAGRTTLWEFKHGTPTIDAPGDQVLMCRRLARATYCRFVVWQETAFHTGKRTLVVHPDQVADYSLTPEAWCEGFDHVWLVRFMVDVHKRLL